MSTQALKGHETLIFVAAFALRYGLLQFTPLPELFMNRVELSTPVTSYMRCIEGVYLFQNNINPYDGGVFYQAPLYLALFTLVSKSPLATNALYALTDVFAAYCLKECSKRQKLSIQEGSWSSTAVIISFLFNPFTIANSVARSTLAFNNLAILASIALAMHGKPHLSMAMLALSTYLSLYPVLLFLPLMMLCRQYGYNNLLLLSTSFLASISIYLTLSFALLGSWDFLLSTYGTILLLPDLTCNIGLWWYFFIEMFDSFRNFFLGVFQLHLVIYVVPLCIKIRKHPLFIITTIIGIICIFKSYPSAGDLSLYLSLLPLQMQYASGKGMQNYSLNTGLRYSFIAAATLMYATVLGPTFYHLWIYAGSGNANFFYAITLVYNLGLIVMVTDWLYAVLRADWEESRPEMKGKEIIQI